MQQPMLLSLLSLLLSWYPQVCQRHVTFLVLKCAMCVVLSLLLAALTQNLRSRQFVCVPHMKVFFLNKNFSFSSFTNDFSRTSDTSDDSSRPTIIWCFIANISFSLPLENTAAFACLPVTTHLCAQTNSFDPELADSIVSSSFPSPTSTFY